MTQTDTEQSCKDEFSLDVGLLGRRGLTVPFEPEERTNINKWKHY